MTEVDVWVADLDVVGWEPLSSLLDEAEQERAGRLRIEAVRRRFVVSHALVRQVLGDGAYVVGPHGKPALPGRPPFSLAHSGDLALLAVCETAEVGVDVEALRPVERLQALAERIMSPDELAAFGAAADPVRCFFDTWARKEAVVKATGEGVTRELRTLSEERVAVVPLDLGDAYAAALAVLGADAVDVVWRR